MTEATLVLEGDVSADNEIFFGHPRGVLYLSMTEAWERFSFYGMRTLLILYMVQELLLPGHIEHVAGMLRFRALLEGVLGHMSTQAFASQVFGLYAGLVYFTPMFGGWLADRFFGARTVVLAGIALMTAGHFAMAFEQSVLIALTLLVLGSGCLKGNIASQVGPLYPAGDEGRRAQGYAIFSTGINIGAMIGPFVCGLLGEIYGWSVAFGTAGVMMVVAATIYLSGQRYLADERPIRKSSRAGPKLSSDQWRMIVLIVIVIMVGLMESLGYDQMYNVGLIWVDARVNSVTPFGSIPTAWFASIDAGVEVLSVPILIALWRWQARRGTEPDELNKIAIGAVLMGLGNATLAIGAAYAGAGKASLWVPLLAYPLIGFAFVWYWPVTLALVSRHAPKPVRAVMMAGAYFVAFCSGVGSGFFGRFYEPLGDVGFWALIAAISVSGALMLMLVGPWLRRTIASTEARISD